MRRLMLVAELLVMVAVFVGAPTGCEGSSAGVTKVYVANHSQNPFHPNGGDRLDLGCSRQILTLGHSNSADIRISRNNTILATLKVVSLVDQTEATDYEVAIRVTEPTVDSFQAVPDTVGVISVTVEY
jgi:hypothetical protein